METANIKYLGQTYTIKIGDKFNRLTILSLHKKHSDNKVYASCLCECGNVRPSILVRSLLSGNTKSCGCLNRDLTIARNYKHGDANRENKSKLYRIWADMNRRCRDKRRDDACYYANKGIIVCEDWKNYNAFKFWALKNGYNDSLTIDRIDSNKNYCPDNCRWIPFSEQSRNRTSNHYITYNNEVHTLTEWANILNIGRSTLSNRLNQQKWPIEKAFTSPVKK